MANIFQNINLNRKLVFAILVSAALIGGALLYAINMAQASHVIGGLNAWCASTDPLAFVCGTGISQGRLYGYKCEGNTWVSINDGRDCNFEGMICSGDGTGHDECISINQTSCVAPPSNLVSWWPLDEPQVASEYGDIMNRNPAVDATHPTWVTGKSGQPADRALQYNILNTLEPADDTVEVANEQNLDFVDLDKPWTIAIDVKLEPKQPQYGQYLVFKQSYLDNYRGWTLYANDQGADELCFGFDDGSYGYSTVCGSRDIIDSQWHNLAVSYDPTLGSGVAGISFFVDGMPDPKVVLSNTLNTLSIVNNRPMKIGGQRYLGDAYVPVRGDIDNPALWNRALTPTEVSGVAAGVVPTLGLKGNWRFDEGSGMQAADSSGNNNHGTLLPPGPAPISAKVGGGLQFDGSDDTLLLHPLRYFKEFPNNWSYTFWTKPEKADPTYSPAVWTQYVNDPVTPEREVGTGIHVGKSGIKVFVHTANVFESVISWIAPSAISAWTHVALVVQKPAGAGNPTAILYVNGQQVGTGIIPAPTAFASAVIGSPSYPPYPYQGGLDEIAFYSRPLSSDEILAGFNVGNAGMCKFAPDTTPPTQPVPLDPIMKEVNAYVVGADGIARIVKGLERPVLKLASRFDWQDATDNSPNPLTYEFQVSANSNFSLLTINVLSILQSEYTNSQTLADGIYYWRARARDAVGNLGPWSSPQSFIIDTTAPTLSNFSAPNNTNMMQAGGAVSDLNSGSDVQLSVADPLGNPLNTYLCPLISVQGQPTQKFSGFVVNSELTNAGTGASLSDGPYNLQASHTDRAGNSGSAGPVSSVVDRVPPIVTGPGNQVVSVTGATLTSRMEDERSGAQRISRQILEEDLTFMIGMRNVTLTERLTNGLARTLQLNFSDNRTLASVIKNGLVLIPNVDYTWDTSVDLGHFTDSNHVCDLTFNGLDLNCSLIQASGDIGVVMSAQFEETFAPSKIPTSAEINYNIRSEDRAGNQSSVQSAILILPNAVGVTYNRRLDTDGDGKLDATELTLAPGGTLTTTAGLTASSISGATLIVYDNGELSGDLTAGQNVTLTYPNGTTVTYRGPVTFATATDTTANTTTAAVSGTGEAIIRSAGSMATVSGATAGSRYDITTSSRTADLFLIPKTGSVSAKCVSSTSANGDKCFFEIADEYEKLSTGVNKNLISTGKETLINPVTGAATLGPKASAGPVRFLSAKLTDALGAVLTDFSDSAPTKGVSAHDGSGVNKLVLAPVGRNLKTEFKGAACSRTLSDSAQRVVNRFLTNGAATVCAKHSQFTGSLFDLYSPVSIHIPANVTVKVPWVGETADVAWTWQQAFGTVPTGCTVSPQTQSTTLSNTGTLQTVALTFDITCQSATTITAASSLFDKLWNWLVNKVLAQNTHSRKDFGINHRLIDNTATGKGRVQSLDEILPARVFETPAR